MKYITFAIIFYIVYQLTYFFGAFAFPQIIGSIRVLNTRPNLLFAIVFWTFIVIAVSFAVYKFLFNYIIAYIIGLAIPFVLTLRTKNIE